MSLLAATSCSFAQAGKEKPKAAGEAGMFIGHWISEYVPPQAFDIYRDGSLVIVRHYDASRSPGSFDYKYVAHSTGQNVLAYQVGRETTELIMNDAGNRLYVNGRQFDKR